MKRTHRGLIAVVMATVLTSTAAASTGAWTAKDMKTAATVLHYPKAGARKTVCRGKTVFRCVATFKHHRRRVFYAQWQGEGGWICAGPNASTCKPLKHGFVPKSLAAFEGGPAGVASAAARGYMNNRYKIPDPYVSSPCTQTGTLAWACGYYVSNTATVTVTIALKSAKGGYVLTGSS